MKPTEYEAGRYLDGDVRILVPAYQRPYEWDVDRWTDLWRDLAHQYRLSTTTPGSPPHFMGALILEKTDAPSESPVHAYFAIDGQQRLLTLFIVAAALRDHEATLAKKKVAAKNPLNTITPKYGKPCSRLVVRPQNQVEMDELLKGAALAEIPSAIYETALAQAYRFFRYQLWRGLESIHSSRVEEPPRAAKGKAAPAPGSYTPWGTLPPAKKQIDIATTYNVLTQQLRLLELMLQPTDEDSSVIFETMNSKSTPLRQFDLLRNSMFVRMPTTRATFYDKRWQPVESVLTSVTYTSLRAEPEEQFLYEYLISTGEDKVTRESLHRRWVNNVIDSVGYAVTAKTEQQFEKDFAEPLVEAACLYPLAVGQKKSHTALGKTWSVTDEQHQVIKEVMAASGGPAVPLFMQVLTDLQADKSKLTDAEALEMLFNIQSFIVRLILGGETLSPLRATLMAAAASVTRPLTPARMKQALTDAGWLSDKEVLANVETMSTADFTGANIFPILRGIERHLSGTGAHPMPFGSGSTLYSIEHVYPQTENIGPDWTAELAAWKVSRDAMDERRYALGNLTAVTGYDNKRNGKKPFSQKKALIVQCAPLKLHGSITSQSKWTPTVIDKRSRLLAGYALAHWPGP